MRKFAFSVFSLSLLAAICTGPAAHAQVAVGISVGFAPPALPIYEQPVCPAPDYIWTPGYWAWDPDVNDYYWVPGTWVLAPETGLLWTPPWWGWDGGAFVFHDGFWGPTVGFYGGVVYGFGYFGVGFEGGYWQSGHFFYNQSVVNVNVTDIHNVYARTVVNNITVSHVSYNGGPGGITARPTPQEEAADNERHVPATSEQTQHLQTARSNPELRASNNQGKPRIAATSRPGDFSGSHVVQAKSAGGEYHAPAGRTAAGAAGTAGRSNAAVHASDLPHDRAPAPNTGNAKLDKKYQKQQDQLYAKQEKERQQLQKQQDEEHLQADHDKADQAARQQLEQKHQQQTEELQQRHQQEQQELQSRQGHTGRG